MSFTPPDFDSILAALKRDVANLAPDARIADDSDWQIRANAAASAIEGLYQHQAWIVRQIFPDTADSDMLELHAAVRGLKRKKTTAASGTATATGTVGTAISAGLLLKTAADTSYQTTADAVIGSNGQADVAIAAVTAGTAGNLSAGTSLTWQAPPLGITGTATAGDLVGGTDAETDASLLARLLDLIRRPPAGGNKYDYRRWALEVDGVSTARVFPLRRGLGTVDVLITSSGGLPSQATLDAVQAYIDDVRPVRAKEFLVFAPTLRTVDNHILITPASGYTLDTATPYVQAAYDAYFNDLQPGDPYVRSQLEARISDLDCVADRQIVTPAGNVAAVVDATKVEWLRAGTLTQGVLA